MKIDNYHPRQLFRTVSQIDVQRIMLGFLVEGHICILIIGVANQSSAYVAVMGS